MTDDDKPKMDADKFNDEQTAQKKVWPKDEPEAFEEQAVAGEQAATEDASSEPFSDTEVGGFDSLDTPNRADLEDQLTKSEQKVHEYWDQLTRMKAEMDNIQRRSERDVANAHKFGTEKLLTDLLNVVDSLERGLECKAEIADDERAMKVYEGLELTRDLMMNTLERFGVVQISPKNEIFDPKLHEAISMIASPDVAPNTVIEVMQPGYLLNERLIRPAMVVVAK